MSIFGRSSKYSTVKAESKKIKIDHGIFMKCEGCATSVFKEEWDKIVKGVCPYCGFHRRLKSAQRIELTADAGTFEEIATGLRSVDMLGFVGVSSYADKLEENYKKTGLDDAMVVGLAKIDGHSVALGVMDFDFLAASMGSVVGEKFVRLTEAAIASRLPLVVFTASGGARMYEGMFSLMQMAKTSGAVERLMKAGLPYFVVMTSPTTAGVSASFATLGDVIIAEPGALIGFAGQRVIRDTTQAVLPQGFQTAEFLMRKGLIDRVVHRRDIRRELSLLLDCFEKSLAVKVA